MKKAITIGAVLGGLSAWVIQIVCSTYRSQGEDLLGLILAGFWFVAVAPLWLCCRLVGYDWHGGDGFNMGAGMFAAMTIIDAALGALLALLGWSFWQLVRKLFRTN